MILMKRLKLIKKHSKVIKQIKKLTANRGQLKIIAKLQDFSKNKGLIFYACVLSLLVAFYWTLLASNRYVSESHAIIQTTDLANSSSIDISSMILGGSNNNRSDLLLVRDHLLSVDMLKKLDTALNLRAHYSDSSHDLLSRFWFKNAPIEWFYRYYLTRVQIELDDYSGVLTIKSQGYNPRIAFSINQTLLDEGESFINQMGQNLAQSQIDFLERQVFQADSRLQGARQKLLEYQNKKSLISPQDSAQGILTIISQLESSKTQLETQKRALLAYLVSNHPQVIQINQQIGATAEQINQEKMRLTSLQNNSLNKTVEEFQRLQMDEKFAEDLYQAAKVALEKGRIETSRSLKKVAAVQLPTYPEYSVEPKRIYSIICYTFFIFLLTGLMHLIAIIIRDHND